MTDKQMADAFNEWMRRYIEEPERFMREFQQVVEFLEQQSAGQVPSYGEECAAYMRQLVSEQVPG